MPSRERSIWIQDPIFGSRSWSEPAIIQIDHLDHYLMLNNHVFFLKLYYSMSVFNVWSNLLRIIQYPTKRIIWYCSKIKINIIANHKVLNTYFLLGKTDETICIMCVSWFGYERYASIFLTWFIFAQRCNNHTISVGLTFNGFSMGFWPHPWFKY